MPLYNHLKEYRAKINVNQHEMGKLAGVSRQTISQIERGDYSPSVTLALKIAKIFGVPVEEIFQYEEEKMNNEKAIENKKEDNRAFGKFALIIAASMLVGAVMGAASVFFKNGQKTLAEMLVNGLGIVAPFLPMLLTTIVILMNAVTEKQCRKLYRGWDGEDEDIVNRIEMKLSNVLIATSVLLILTFFSFSAGIYGLDEMNPYNIFTQVKIFALFGGMIYAMVALTLIQKQIVNFEKEINPEKKGSVYDPKFQKKWLESCDEGEKLQIYKSAYKAYQMTQDLYAALDYYHGRVHKL